MSKQPQIRVITEETNRDYHWRQAESAFKSISYPTYKELRKNIKKHLEENLEPMVSVYRTQIGRAHV